MTDEEKRNKAIDEISKLICGQDLRVVSCDGDCHLHYTCLSAAFGMAIANEGYRKEEEVRKETAKEILQKWYQENKATNFEQDYVLELACDYGVEVEE